MKAHSTSTIRQSGKYLQHFCSESWHLLIWGMGGKSCLVELKVFRHVWKLLFRKNACSKEFIWASQKNNPLENKSTGTTSLTVTSCLRNSCSCTLLKPLDNKQCSSFTRLCIPTDGGHWLRNQYHICATIQFLYPSFCSTLQWLSNCSQEAETGTWQRWYLTLRVRTELGTTMCRTIRFLCL